MSGFLHEGGGPAVYLAQVVDRLPQPAYVVVDSRLVHANASFLALLGARRDELTGRALGELLHPDSRALVAEQLASLSDETPTVGPIDLRWSCGDGAVTLSATHVLLPGAEPRAVLVVARDSVPLRALDSRLILADRLAALGTLAAGVAHEINNPLTYVLANLELVANCVEALERGASDPDVAEMKQVVSEAIEGARRIGRIVDGLRVFSRVDDDKRAPLDLVEVLEVSTKLASNEIRHRARLVKRFGPVPRVEADEARLSQVFLNLLVNAAQAIPEGRAEEHEVVVSTGTDERGRAVVEISDTGSGISSPDLDRVFDPFFTTKAVGHGTGLGLAMCHGIVTSLGGEIGVRSTIGQGTTFRITLPPSTKAPSEPVRVNVPSSGRTRRGRILVIDDEAPVGRAIRRLLGKKHEVTVLTSGREALDCIARGARFDVVLCDLMMPSMSGMELYAQVSVIAPEQAERFAFVTGGAFTPAARAFVEALPNVRIEKPIDGFKLRMVVKGLVENRPPIEEETRLRAARQGSTES